MGCEPLTKLLAALEATGGLETDGTLANMASKTGSLFGLLNAVGAMNPKPAVSGLLDQIAGLVHSGGIISASTTVGHERHLTCTKRPVSGFLSLKQAIRQCVQVNNDDVGRNSNLDLASAKSSGSPGYALVLASMLVNCSTPNGNDGGCLDTVERIIITLTAASVPSYDRPSPEPSLGLAIMACRGGSYGGRGPSPWALRF